MTHQNKLLKKAQYQGLLASNTDIFESCMNKGGEKRARHKRRGKRTFTASDRKGAKIPVHGGYLHLFLSRVSYTQADTDAEEKKHLSPAVSNTYI